MTQNPPITVFMPVYNGLTYLPEAVDSILGQTFGEFEFLIIDDGSTDGGLDYLRMLGDSRVRLIAQPRNIGLRANYNCGFAEAKGRYIAIMDQDDIAMPERLALQYEFMEENEEVGLCGGKAEIFGVRNEPPWVRYFGHEDLRIALLFENPICHPTVMLRTSVLRTHHLEYPENPYAEEYLLWTYIAKVSQVRNLPQVVLRYRTHERQVSADRSATQTESANRVIRSLLVALGIHPTTSDLAVHSTLGLGFNPFIGRKAVLKDWCRRLVESNNLIGQYPAELMASQLNERMELAAARNTATLRKMTPLRQLHWVTSATLRHYRMRG